MPPSVALPRILWHGPMTLGSSLADRVSVTRACTPEPWSAKTGRRNHFLRPLVEGMNPAPELLVVHTGDFGLPLDVHEIALPKLAIFLDPDNCEWLEDYASLFDAVIVTQKREADRLSAELGIPVEWVPPCADVGHDPMPEFVSLKDRPIDVAFVGNMGKVYQADREAFFTRVRNALGEGVRCHFGNGNWQEIYSRSKIVLNHAMRGEITNRTFEALLCGSFLLTPDESNGLDNLLSMGFEYETYARGDAVSATERIRARLSHLGAADEIAQAGRRRVRAQHLRVHRDAAVRNVIEALWSRMPGGPRRDADLDRARMIQAVLWMIVTTGPVFQWDFQQRIADRLQLALASVQILPNDPTLFALFRYLKGLVHLGLEEPEAADVCFAESACNPSFTPSSRLQDLRSRLDDGVVFRESVRSQLVERALGVDAAAASAI